jgi:hypothetical protein
LKEEHLTKKYTRKKHSYSRASFRRVFPVISAVRCGNTINQQSSKNG